MKQLLTKLETHFRRKNITLYNALSKGLDEVELSTLTRNLKHQLPTQILDLFAWKNGTRIDSKAKFCERWFMPFNFFMSVEDLLDLYSKFDFLNSKFGVKVFSQDLLPIFKSGWNEYTLVNFNKNSSDFGKIFFFQLHEPELDYLSGYGDSIESFFAAIEECYENNLFFIDTESGCLTEKVESSMAIFRKHNPESSYWKFYFEE